MLVSLDILDDTSITGPTSTSPAYSGARIFLPGGVMIELPAQLKPSELGAWVQGLRHNNASEKSVDDIVFSNILKNYLKKP